MGRGMGVWVIAIKKGKGCDEHWVFYEGINH